MPRQSFDSEVESSNVRWWSYGSDEGYIVEVGGMSGSIYHDYDLPQGVKTEMTMNKDSNKTDLASFKKMPIMIPSYASPTVALSKELKDSISGGTHNHNDSSEFAERDELSSADGSRAPSYISFESLNVPPPPADPETEEIDEAEQLSKNMTEKAKVPKWRKALVYMRVLEETA
ncbi:hypothetical protein GLAREA_02708 [Glarea lozoyensis ATCC 20868]|uniref:Uncharacterized protein n=1 Tax=Glarea lozoyensis (strain ATCC 20868 / MF5171) TaxID=1116229 RepID=S3CNR7_GLAL2|nr:uncharacterized protein GLAREA_02708 [Glarea lozoyensis ATCC 20868]EPE26794.1 hypothetical protein GLAREA_02708 [Glarea lozoyensis ATCC 20868]